MNVKKVKPAESLLEGKSRANPGQQFLVIVKGGISLSSIMLLSSDHHVVPSIMDYAYANWSLSVTMWWDAIAFAFRKKGLCLFVHGNSDIKKSTFGEK